ncbi:hypothetical protein BEN47_04520 [Hymenobacter lapidarius]|uniref:PsbP C-terminal domain-containing protein n=1 Tax=Hymenobacter lapidarius TaxID=1908237 RepID=A0A1G1SVK0_9BACT|nr:hypothetical protein [Hymenobacter lapidarius]OGX82642.1 hypothetical protein BEN47_04520 [Hymenobacter lapidarius]
MLRATFASLLLLLLLIGPAQAQRYNVALSPAPAGFTWQPLPASNAAILLPEGWYYKAEAVKGAATCYLTQQEIGESGEYQTGLSLQVVRKAKAQTKRPAPEYAELLMLRTGFGQGQQQMEKASSVEGAWHKWTVCYHDAPPDADARIVFQLALANAKTDTLYLLTFESPEKDWAEAWTLGQVMVRELALDARQ